MYHFSDYVRTGKSKLVRLERGGHSISYYKLHQLWKTRKLRKLSILKEIFNTKYKFNFKYLTIAKR